MPPPDYSTAFQLKLDQISHFRRELQVEYHAEYERALVEVKDDLMEKEGPELTETMKDEIRDWFNKEKYKSLNPVFSFYSYFIFAQGGAGQIS